MSIIDSELDIFDIVGNKITGSTPFYPNDSVQDIKEKIQFMSKDRYITVDMININNSKNSPIETKISLKEKIYYHNIFNIIKNNNLLKNNPLDLVNQGTLAFKEYYREIIKIFPKISKDLLTTIISVKFIKIFPGQFEKYTDFLLEATNLERSENKRKFRTSRRSFVDKSQDILNYTGDVYDYTTLLLLAVFNLKKEDNSNRNINLIMKEFKLSNDIPFISTINKETSTVVTKVHDSVSKENIKEWTINSKNTLKRPKGLTIKVKNGPDYSTVIFTRDSRLLVKLGGTENNLNRLDPKISKNIKTLISKITGNKKEIFGTIDYSKISIKTNIKIDPTLLKDSEIVSFSNRKNSQLDIILTGLKDNNSVNSVLNSVLKEISVLKYSKIIIKQNIKKEINKNKIPNIGCQKDRKPIIRTNENDITYSINVNNQELICDPKSIFRNPGFTVKNIPCCFIKDQRDKEIFITNTTNKAFKNIMDDAFVLSRRKLITGKILGIGRYGMLPPEILKYFDNSFIRIGTNQNTNSSFIDSVNYASGNKKNIEIDQDDFNTLENGLVAKKFSDIDEYINSFKDDDHLFLIDLLSNTVKMNIVVVGDYSVSCLNYQGFIYKQTILIYKNNGVYEPICKIMNNSIIQKTFTKNEIAKFIDIYNFSCNIEYYTDKKVNLINAGLFNLESIKSQVLNSSKNIAYILTEMHGVVQVTPRTRIPGVPIVKLRSILLSLNEQMKKMSKITNIQGQILNNGKTVAILGENHTIIPVIPGVPSKTVKVISNIQYFDLTDPDLKDIDVFSELFTKEEIYQRFRYTLSFKIQNYVKEVKEMKKKKTPDNYNEIYSLIKSLLLPEINYFNTKKISEFLVKNICSELPNCNDDQFCSLDGNSCKLSVEESELPNILQKLTTEIINNDKDIINKNIRSDFFNIGDFVIRPHEIVLLSKSDVLKLISK
jgi:hypothetical protein